MFLLTIYVLSRRTNISEMKRCMTLLKEYNLLFFESLIFITGKPKVYIQYYLQVLAVSAIPSFTDYNSIIPFVEKQ